MRDPERLVARIQQYIVRHLFAAWLLGLKDQGEIYSNASDLVQQAFYGTRRRSEI